MEQQDLNKRLLMALVLSFLVFIGYGYFFPATPPTENSTKSTKEATSTHQTPTVVDASVKQTPSSGATVAQSVSKQAPIQKAVDTLLTLNATHFTVTIDTYGRISQMTLLEDKYEDDDGRKLKIFKVDEVKPLELRFADPVLNDEAFKVPYTYKGDSHVRIDSAGQSITLTQELKTLTVTKKIHFKQNGQYTIDVSTSSPAQYFITPGYRPVADTSMYMLVRGALVKGGDNIINTIEDGDALGYEKFPKAKIASAFDRYITSMFFDFKTGINVSVLKEKEDNPLLFVQIDNKLKLNGYIGPKDQRLLQSIHPELSDAVEFGWFSFLSKPFFKVLLWINDSIGNWGWSIILFTLLVKLILFPLSYKGMMSMQKLKDLAPKMKEIKEKYKGDSAKMNMKMMEMYKKQGANPMGGCLPLLLQIPIFFALYRVLLNAVELQGAEWIFWINDLAVMDPIWVLPILMGVSMWFQQRITPSNFTDPLQEKIFKWFPVIMTIFFVYFPAGLVLYWLVNNLFTIAQQYFINYMYAKQKSIAATQKK